MLFTSIEFLLLFLPIVLCGYYLLAKNIVWSNCWLLVSSIFFYAWGEPKFVLMMAFSIAFNFVVALAIENPGKNKYKKIFLILSVVVNLGLLFVFKYLNFTTSNLHEWFPATNKWFEVTKISLPIGISFFTFQALSYVIDVYRGIPAQKSLLNLGLYISFFPQLIAGPIVRYTTVANLITSRKVTVETFSYGVIRFIEGFNKKILLANSFAIVVDYSFSSNNSVAMAWLGAACYMLQIYFDFSGYSDMAIGLGAMFGFKFLENFNYPYISKTVTEFWGRWHISLGTWFRDYVFFSLGGFRIKSKATIVYKLFVVWLLVGIWHGANWTFVLWGMLYWIVLSVERLFDVPRKIKKWDFFARISYRILTLLIVVVSSVLFRADSIVQAKSYLQVMFALQNNFFVDDMFWFNLKENMVILMLGILCSTPVFRWLPEKIYCVDKRASDFYELIYLMGQGVLFLVSFSYLVMSSHNPFIYFNF